MVLSIHVLAYGNESTESAKTEFSLFLSAHTILKLTE
jgi:hypothetical protein